MQVQPKYSTLNSCELHYYRPKNFYNFNVMNKYKILKFRSSSQTFSLHISIIKSILNCYK